MARLSQSAINRQQYIPPHIQQEISNHLQGSVMPSNLKQYINGGYVPPQAQKIIAKQMKNLPTHLKQYSGAFMEQQIRQPTVNPAAFAAPAVASTAHQAAANFMPQDSFSGVVEQPQAVANAAVIGSPPAMPTEQNPYDFIVNPAKPQRSWNLLGGSSSKNRLIFMLGGALGVLIIIIVMLAILSGKPPTTGLIALTQQQNNMITIASSADTMATQQVTKNLAINVQLSLATQQTQLLNFLKTEGTKVNAKQLAAGGSATVTQELANAQAASNYDAVYIQVTQQQLTSYAQSLKQEFNASKKTTERQLLSQQYAAANLLLKQAGSAAQALAT